MDQSELAELIRDTLEGESLHAHDLDRVKVPSGGSTTWEVPSLDGEVSMKVIEGVIVSRATRRAYWSNPEPTDEAPQCSSEDGVEGVGDPGGPCTECPFNEWGSSPKGAGKACKETRQLFVVQPDSLIPIVVTVPPASLANVKAYLLRLLRAQIKGTDVITKISLEKVNNKQGTPYARVLLAAGERLDPEASARMRAYAAAMEPAFQAAARVERSEVEEEDD